MADIIVKVDIASDDEAAAALRVRKLASIITRHNRLLGRLAAKNAVWTTRDVVPLKPNEVRIVFRSAEKRRDGDG